MDDDYRPSGDMQKVAKQYEKAMQKALDNKDGPPRYVEPRCLVCTSQVRDWIEHQLLHGQSYLSIERATEALPEGKIPRRSISNHAKEHMPIQEAAYRAIIEEEASLEGMNFESGIRKAISSRAILELLAQKGIEDVLNDMASVEPKDLIQIIKLKAELDQKTSEIQVDEMKRQVNIVIEAIQNVVSPELQGEIVAEIGRLKRQTNDTTNAEVLLQPPAINAYSDEV